MYLRIFAGVPTLKNNKLFKIMFLTAGMASDQFVMEWTNLISVYQDKVQHACNKEHNVITALG